MDETHIGIGQSLFVLSASFITHDPNIHNKAALKPFDEFIESVEIRFNDLTFHSCLKRNTSFGPHTTAMWPDSRDTIIWIYR